MANKEKKRKDKKSKQRRERKGKLPSSVEALLGYLGGGGPSPAPQGDTRVRERAGVDGYDTLHQIIKSQQMMSANYMANLERMAFKTEITEQLKKQGEESKNALQATKAEVEKIARGYVKKSPEEKIADYKGQIEWQLKRGEKKNRDAIAAAQKSIQKYQDILDFRQSTMPPAASMSPSTQSPSVKAGGSVAGAKIAVSVAPQGSAYDFISAIDPIQGMALGGGSELPASTPLQEIAAGQALMTNAIDQTSTSLTPASGGAAGGAAAAGLPAKTAKGRQKGGKNK